MEKRQKRSMNLENVSDNSLPFPIEIIIMIFAKLPVRSIARCRCVSKLWGSILRRSDFTELFLSRSDSGIPKLLFAAYPKRGELLFYSSLQPQNMDSDSSSVASYLMKFSFNGNYLKFDLVHGLVCFYDSIFLNGNREKVVKICNPSTGQVLTLPKVKSSNAFMWCLLGYDPIRKQFKALAMTIVRPIIGRSDLVCEDYQVLTLESGNLSWRLIECCVPHNPPRKSICINGVLFYTSTDWPTNSIILVSFDISFEKFSLIKTAGTIVRAVLDVTTELVNYNGKLGLLRSEEDISFDGRSISYKLWVLEDHEKHEWSEHTFLFSNVPKYKDGKTQFKFVGLTTKNEIVLSSTYPFCDLFYLNLEKKTTVRVEIQGMEEARDRYYTLLNHVEDVKLY